MGYLVANPHQQYHQNPTPSSQIWAFAQYNRTYAFAQELQERFGVKHTLLGPPHISRLPRERAARLNANLTVRFRTPPPPEHKLNECSSIYLLPLPARPPAPIVRSPAPRPRRAEAGRVGAGGVTCSSSARTARGSSQPRAPTAPSATGAASRTTSRSSGRPSLAQARS